MFVVLLLLFVVAPLVELYVIVQVAHGVGAPETILLLFAISVVGAWLAKRQGIAVLRRMQTTVAEGKVPSREIVDGALVLFAAALMIAPGFLSDASRSCCSSPPIRALVRTSILRRIRAGGLVATRDHRVGSTSGRRDVGRRQLGGPAQRSRAAASSDHDRGRGAAPRHAGHRPARPRRRAPRAAPRGADAAAPPVDGLRRHVGLPGRRGGGARRARRRDGAAVGSLGMLPPARPWRRPASPSRSRTSTTCRTGSPRRGRPTRFDTRFFVARAPDGDHVHDDREHTDSCWIRPADALDRHAAGTFDLILPTLRNLEAIGRCRHGRGAARRGVRRRRPSRDRRRRRLAHPPPRRPRAGRSEGRRARRSTRSSRSCRRWSTAWPAR